MNVSFNDIITIFQQGYCPKSTVREVRGKLSAVMADLNSLEHILLVNDENPNHDPNNGRFIAVGGAKFYPDKAKELGKQIDPADKSGQLTKAGRALSKHGGRGISFPKAAGNKEKINNDGQYILENIIGHPQARIFARDHGRFGKIFDIFTDNGYGRGVRIKQDHSSVIGFLEPLTEEQKKTYFEDNKNAKLYK